MAELQQKLAALASRDFPRRMAYLMAAAALALNISACWKVYRHEPLREAASRSLFASESRAFFDSGIAEPLPVFALKAGMGLGADPDTAVRVEGLAVFALLAAVTFFCGRRRLGDTAGALSTLFIAANPYFGYYAMQGGSHLYALLFLLLFWYWFDSPGGGRREALLAGVAGGLACLSRLDAAWAILIIAALSWAVRRREFALKRAALSLGLALLLAAPYLGWQKAKYSNSLYAQELSLRRWVNLDSYGYAPGAPYQAAPVGPVGFLMRKGAAGAVQDAFKGLGRAFACELPRVIYYKFLFVFIFLGVYAAFTLKNDGLLFFGAAALLPVLPLAGINQVPATGGLELRYYLWATWALCALAGFGFQEILVWLERRLSGAAAKNKA
ncbi:MAG: glycosyltransferase family 39 protein [Elusimicrobia bacterium]|nr:glycosyltransferase family 39 protein [Elusimicrobiota bacterium]